MPWLRRICTAQSQLPLYVSRPCGEEGEGRAGAWQEGEQGIEGALSVAVSRPVQPQSSASLQASWAMPPGHL